MVVVVAVIMEVVEEVGKLEGNDFEFDCSCGGGVAGGVALARTLLMVVAFLLSFFFFFFPFRSCLCESVNGLLSVRE